MCDKNTSHPLKLSVSASDKMSFLKKAYTAEPDPDIEE